MPPGLFKGERTYVLEERDGKTDFTMTEECSGAVGDLVERLMSGIDLVMSPASLKSAAEGQ